MRLPFTRQAPSHEADTFARAQVLLEDGLAIDDVLAQFPAEAEWLRGMLTVSSGVQQTLTDEQPSYYFEASLKAKFLAAFGQPAPSAVPFASPVVRVRGPVAGAAFVSFAAMLGVLTFGFVTADQAVPGDWNYAFKLANERIQYTLSRGDERMNVQINQTEARVYEIQQLASRGDLSATDIQNLEKQARDLANAASQQQLDPLQKSKVASIQTTTNAVLGEVKTKQTSLEPAVNNALQTVNETLGVAAGVGTGPKELPLPTPTPAKPAETATPAPTATATPEPPATPPANSSTTPTR